MLAQTLAGTALNAGVSVGIAVIHRPHVWRETTLALDVKAESERLKTAIREMIEAIDRLVGATPLIEKATHEVLASYRMIAADRGWIRKIQTYIQKGLSAEAAVQRVRRHTREHYTHIGDNILKERLADLEDLASRLLRHLTGEHGNAEELPESAILIAHNLGPGELLDYDRRFLKGVVLEEGVHSAHVAIVARALDIPVVGRIPFLLTHVNKGDKLIVNGEDGTITIAPTAQAIQEAREKIVHIKKTQSFDKELYHAPCKTLDSVPVSLSLNGGLPIDLNLLETFNLEGVGLYRTEIPFMMRTTFPNINAQIEIYQEVFDQANSYPVTFRTLDIGGDKIIPYMWRTSDENPALGWRGIRVSLDRVNFFSQQLRALMSAAQGKPLRLLFPMVSDISEYQKARQYVEHEWNHAKEKGALLPTSLSCGIMLEVPSMVEQVEALPKDVDFISLGTNDLFQFFYASDRTNPLLSDRYDVLSTPFLRYLERVHALCKKRKIPVNVCGEMAGNPLEAIALLALGFRSLSVSGSAVGHLKKMILKLPLKEAEIFLKKALETYSSSLRSDLQDFSKKHNVL